MCTAVCYVLGHTFLLRKKEEEEVAERFFSPQRVDQTMRACHEFFDRAQLQNPLMLKEMQDWFPMHGVITKEFAGLTLDINNNNHLTDEDAKAKPHYAVTTSVPDGDLMLLPLSELVACMGYYASQVSNVRRKELVLLVTYGGHTRLLVAEPRCGHVSVLDPMSPRLRPLTGALTAKEAAAAMALPTGTLYAGVMLMAAPHR